MVIICPNCGQALTFPKVESLQTTCTWCGKAFTYPPKDSKTHPQNPTTTNHFTSESLENLKRLTSYYYKILKQSVREQKLLLDVRSTRDGFVDVSGIIEREVLLSRERDNIVFKKPKPQAELTAEGSEKLALFNKLLKLSNKYGNNPYELELLYCYLFIVGEDAKGKYFAPLFYTPVNLKYDTTEEGLVLSLLSDEVQINHRAIEETHLDKELPPPLRELRCPSVPIELKEVNVILQTLSNVNPVIQAKAIESFQFEVGKKLSETSGGKFTVYNNAYVILARKSNVYLIDDLKALQDINSADSVEHCILQKFFQEKGGDSGEQNWEKKREIQPYRYFFPFYSNQKQREVPEHILAHELVQIQGPPGTGKSQTISNLVCHLVAEGKKVLVTSQKEQALRVVVENFLTKVGSDYLYMALLGDDQESKRKLKTLLDGIDAEISQYNEDVLEQQLKDSETELDRIEQQIEQLHIEFNNAQEFERKKLDRIDKPIGEVISSYGKIKEFDVFDHSELVASVQVKELANQLKTYVEGFNKIADYCDEIQDLVDNHKIPTDLKQIEDFLKGLCELEKLLEEELEICPRTISSALHEHLKLMSSNFTTAIDNYTSIEIRVQDFFRSRERVLSDSTIGELYKSLGCKNIPVDSFEKDIQRLEDVRKDVDRISEIQPLIQHIKPNNIPISFIETAFSIYQEKKNSWFKGRSFKEAMETLKRLADSSSKKLTENDEKVIAIYIEVEQLRKRISENSIRLDYLSIKDMNANDRVQIHDGLSKRIALLKLLLERNTIGLLLAEAFGDWIRIEECEFKEEEEIVSKLEKATAAARAFYMQSKGYALIEKLRLQERGPSFDELCYAYKNGVLQEFSDILKRLRILFPLVPVKNALRQAESNELKSYRETVETLKEMRLIMPARFQKIVGNIDAAVEAAMLRGIIVEASKEKPESTEVITSKIRELEEEKLEIIKQLIVTKIRLSMVQCWGSVRRDVTYFSGKLTRRGKRSYSTFEELKKEKDVKYERILSILPCWVLRINDVARIFPLKAGLFDVVIVDESSQCNSPSAISILYRGKKAVIVGDDKQLPNVEMKYIGDDLNRAFYKESGIDNLPYPDRFDAKRYSLYDLCNVFTDKSVFLNEHFRSYPEIINFCNKNFYTPPGLVLAKTSLSNTLGKALNLIPVEGALDDANLKVNKKEAEEVISFLKRMFSDPKYEGQTFGVISLFRPQTDYIFDLARNEIDRATWDHFDLRVDAADGFQGDERDIILYSFRYAPNSSKAIFAIEKDFGGQEGEKRLNVAFSRARKQIFCFVSEQPERFPEGLIKNFVMYVKDPKTLAPDCRPWESGFEMAVHSMIELKGKEESLGLSILPQYKSCGFRIDLVVHDGKGKVLAVECDGWTIHYDHYGQLYPEDIDRQNILERAGWKVMRITSRDFYHDPENAIRPILEYFRNHKAVA